MDVFENISEQAEAKRLLRAALADDGPAHAYLFYGPPGVGKRAAVSEHVDCGPGQDGLALRQ